MKNKKILLIVLISIFIGITIGITYAVISKKEKQNLEPKVLDLKVIDHGYTTIDYDKKYKDIFIDDYDVYSQLMDSVELEKKLTKEDFKKSSYLVLAVPFAECAEEIVGVNKLTLDGNKLTVLFDAKYYCPVCVPADHFFLVEFDKKDVKDDITVFYEYNEIYREENCDPNISYKPLIYLYPKIETNVTLKLGYPQKLTTTYPKYNDEWKVLAYPNGNLIDLSTGRNLYGLYWEGLNTESKGVQEEGFIVKGEDVIPFLEEKLAILGLNEREANEFIIYWLPLLEVNEYNYIRFETKEEIDRNMPLYINPKPDTVIRILMEFKALDEPIDVVEQNLETPTRTGFTVVEWGGTKLK